MVELKDVLLIGAVGAAGILGYKAIKGGLTSVIPSVTLPENKPAVDYELSDTLKQLIESNSSQYAQLLQAIKDNPGGGSTTVINYGGGSTLPSGGGSTLPSGGDGSGSEDGKTWTPKELTEITDAATFALEESGAYGFVRQSEAAAAKQFDTNNTARLNALGGLGGVIGLGDAGAKLATDLTAAVGLSPAASGTVGIIPSLVSGISLGNGARTANASLAIGEGIKAAGEGIYNFFKGLF